MKGRTFALTIAVLAGCFAALGWAVSFWNTHQETSSTASVAQGPGITSDFELVDQTVQAGPDKVISIRLMNTKTGKPVPDAVIFATRLDMAPDGMQEMATKIAPVPGAEPGSYKFKATFGMAGRWQLSLGAKVQGEAGTVELCGNTCDSFLVGGEMHAAFDCVPEK